MQLLVIILYTTLFVVCRVKREKSGSGWPKISRKIVPCWLRPTNYTTNKWTKKWIG
jgi:hypothetical protein